MAKLKIKFNDNTSITEVENKIAEILQSRQNEINFNVCEKIANQLGAKRLNRKSSGKGSQERFHHPYLNDHPHFHGIFGVHVKPAGKNNFIVMMRNFKDYFLKGIQAIILIKRKKGETK